MQQEAEKTPLESHLVACVQEYLSLYLYDNAIFLAERLAAEFPNEGNVYLLSTAYHRAGQSYRAYHLLKGLHSPQSRYLFATCAMQMGRLAEAEAALVPENDMSRVPNGAAGYYLLGRIAQLSNRHNVAVAYFNTAIQLDPMMWQSFEELCSLGADHEAKQYVNAPSPQEAGATAGVSAAGAPNAATVPQQHDQSAAAASSGGGGGITFAMHTPTDAIGVTGAGGDSSMLNSGGDSEGGAAPMSILRPDTQQQPEGGSVIPPYVSLTGRTLRTAPGTGGGAPHSLVTPPHGATPCITPAMPGARPSGPPPAPRANASWPPSAMPTGTPSMLANGAANSLMQNRKFLDEGKMRKVSSKLFVEPASVLRQVASAYAPHGASASGSGSVQYRSKDDAAGLAASAAVTGVPYGERSQEGQAAAVSLLQILGEGYRLLCAFQCQEAVDAFSRLPARHFQTGWVLMAIGRAYFEMVDYHSSAKAFSWARELDPYRLQGLETYSTVLWHMKREVDLASLAQGVVALDRHSPHAWCVVGNCFSLQKEHDAALRFFQRALQVDPTLSYAYTLCGHEYFTNEDFDKGITCYRNAIRIDPRHYNAWFGMGHIYYRQERYSMAEYHFKRAWQINERSSVLRCYWGMALAKLKRNAEALEALSAAVAADPRNPLARFERAALLQAAGASEEALAELKALQDVAPREASVLFQMGKVLKKLGRTQEAMQAFSAALDLQPPSADTNLIKSAIDRVALSDGEEEEEM